MTTLERNQIRTALRLIMTTDDGFHRGIGMLAKLAGLRYPVNPTEVTPDHVVRSKSGERTHQ